jgi:hypothetical protein
MLNTSPSPASSRGLPILRPRPDQAQRWNSFTSPVPFTQAAAHVLNAHAIDGQRSDVVAVDLRTWAFGSSDGETMAITRVPLPGRADSAPLALRELAFSQLCAKAGAPAPYVRALPAKLQVALVNWGLGHEPQNALLRLADNEVRAIVSERYAAIDDTFLLEVVDDVLKSAGYRDDALVRAAATGPHTLLRITVPAFGVAVKRDDIIEWGLDLANSELGLRSVQVTPITHRLVCTNGMRAWKSEAGLRMRHVGDADRLRDQLRDAVPVAFAEAKGDIARWVKATELLIDNALEEIEGLRAFGLSTGEVQSIGRTLAVDEGMLASPSHDLPKALRTSTSVFALANAITATARERTDVASRLNLESIGHRYLSARAS